MAGGYVDEHGQTDEERIAMASDVSTSFRVCVHCHQPTPMDDVHPRGDFGRDQYGKLHKECMCRRCYEERDKRAQQILASALEEETNG